MVGATRRRRRRGSGTVGSVEGACQVDVRIGIVQSMKELDIELPEDARPRQGPGRHRGGADGGRDHPLADRPEGPPGRGAGRQGRLRGGRPAGSDRRVGFGIS